jgi:hypothetical protein
MSNISHSSILLTTLSWILAKRLAYNKIRHLTHLGGITMKRFAAQLSYLFFAMFCLSGFAQKTFAESGPVSWGPWSFDWVVADDSGIGIRNLKFEGRLLMHRGDMPVIRVKYDRDGGQGGCGPYADRISWGNLSTDNNCHNGQKLCQRTFTSGGREWLEVSGRAFIGSYDIVQAWYFTRDGEVQPRLFSRGLQCQINHSHHPYWQLDFDVDGSAGDESFLFLPSFGNTGYGPGWFKYGNEFDSRRNPAERPQWYVRDAQTSRGVFILPSTTDGPHDGFSSINAAIRLYHGNEVGPWPFGATGELQYNNSENVSVQDNVFWYVGHLFHSASEGPSQYHSVGPILRVKR